MNENTNSPLIPETKDFKEPQNTYNANQYNSSSNEIIIRMKYPCNYGPGIVFFVIIFAAFVVCLVKFRYAMAIMILTVLLLMALFSLIFCLIASTKKIKLIKGQNNNTLKIEDITLINYPISTLIMNLQDVVVDKLQYTVSSEDSYYTRNAIIIANTFKNSQDIDLNLSNIKNKPVENVYYIIKDTVETVDNTLLLIKNFIGNSSINENPAFFNIYKYMGKKDEEPLKYSKYKLNRYMRMSEHFFSFYFKEKCCILPKWKCIKLTLPIIVVLLFEILFTVYPTIMFIEAPNKSYSGMISWMFITFFIPAIIAIIFIIRTCKQSLRMDIIYSSDFNQVFIALLNFRGSSYKKTFIFDLNLIERFILEPYKGSFDESILKVAYKDRTIQEIFRIDENKYVLEGLMFVLNQKLNSNFNENNLTPNY